MRADPLTGLRVVLADPEHLLGADPVDDPSIDDGGPMLGRIITPSRDLFWSVPAVGTHERLPLPGALDALSSEQMAEALESWRAAIAGYTDAACVHLAVEPGATRADLYAFDFVPQLVARERERFGAYATRTMGGNLLADLVQEEVKQRERIVAIDDDVVLMAPYGSRVPYQLMIAPRRPRRAFQDDGPTGAAMLGDALRRLRQKGLADVHVFLRTAPSGAEFFCWRIELLPVVASTIGLELATGLQHNPVTPEAAASALRAL